MVDARFFRLRSIRGLIVVSYLAILFAVMLSHVHDGDAVAGYDEHCLACGVIHHAPATINTAPASVVLLHPTGRLASVLPAAIPADFVFIVRGRSPPVFS